MNSKFATAMIESLLIQQSVNCARESSSGGHPTFFFLRQKDNFLLVVKDDRGFDIKEKWIKFFRVVKPMFPAFKIFLKWYVYTLSNGN
jgi:hypothetical protein